MTEIENEWWKGSSANDGFSLNERYVREYANVVAPEHAMPLLSLGTPISVVSAYAERVIDVAGVEYIDLRSGGGVFPFGHRPPEIVQALRMALEKFDIGDWQIPSSLRVDLAMKLNRTMTAGSWQWRYFVSGSESNEFALRTALMATGRERILSLEGGYHGQTGFAAAVTDELHLNRSYPKVLADVVRIPNGDVSRLDQTLDDSFAAVILEPVQLSDGVSEVDGEFLERLRARCSDANVVLIFDEVKCGFSRTGPVWAHQRMGVVPDILVAGKALSGGVYPVSTVGIRTDSGNPLLEHHQNDARSSFGGSHLGMAVAIAALDQLTDVDQQATFALNGTAFLEEILSALASAEIGGPVVPRRLGMAFEIFLGESDLAAFVAADLLHNGVIVPFPKSARLLLLPCLTMPREESRLAASKIAKSIQVGRFLLEG